MTTKKLTYLVAATIAATALLRAETYTWTGGTSNVWSDPTNWDANGVPDKTDNGVGAGAANDNVIVITNGDNDPTDSVPAYANGQNTPDRTPRFDIRAGASLTINQSTFAGSLAGPTQGGDIVTVAAGASLTWVSTSGFQLMRHPGGTQNYNITGGAFTLDHEGGRVDFGFNGDRLSNFNLDGGTLRFTGSSMFGTRFGVTASAASTVTLANGSVFNAASAVFNGNMDDPGGDVWVVFDIQDVGSRLTAKFGAVFPDLAAVEAGEGKWWTSSTLGNENLLSTDNLNGTFTVGLNPSAAPTDAFRITEIALEAENQIRLTWTSQDERTYAIFWSTDLTAFPYDVDDSIPSGGTSTSFTFPDPTITEENPQGGPTIFFRVEENSQP